MEQKRSKLKFVIITLILFFIISYLLASVISLFIQSTPFGNVALIKISGPIMVDKGSFGDVTASSTEIIDFIQQADQDESIEAILLEINSPGGSAVASDEIVKAIQRTNKTTYSVIREIGTSGAYWAASATDTIIANDLSITGSIGVISSYLEFSGLLERYNITYQRLISGKYKDIGTPLKPLQKDEEEILIKKLNKIHDYFIASVAENRGMTTAELKPLATGEFYLGSEALDNGLIDMLGDRETAKELIQKQHNLTEVEFAEFSSEPSLLDLFTGVFQENSFNIGKGIGASLKDQQLSITT